MWLELHDGDGFPFYVNMDNVVDFRWYEREGYTCLLTTAPVAEKLHRLYVRENAQQIIDMAVQMHGGMGVKKGVMVESLYREIRALRIYEGATEVQQLIIGKDVLKG
mgnify:CR=1 FL=1